MDPLTILSLVGTVGGGVSSLFNGYMESQTAKRNAEIYEAQARNIQSQKGIVANQYATQGRLLQGQAFATAGRQGVKVSGTVAQSISSSLTQLNLDKSYELFNLETERIKALNSANYQNYLSNASLSKGFWGAASSVGTALGKLGDSNFFGNKTPNKNLISGGVDYRNKNVIQGQDLFA